MTRALCLMVALMTVTLGAQPLMADHDGKANKHQHGNKDDDDAQGWRRGDGYEYRVYGPGQGEPPGWTHGKKTGWGNCGLPPGQAKKYGCQTYSYEGRPYYYYQDDRGRIIVRRPTVEVYGWVDSH